MNTLLDWAWFPQRSRAGWNWLLTGCGDEPGWILEDDQGICGFAGNFRQRFHVGRETLQAATGHSLVVLPRARGGSRRILEAYRDQAGGMSTFHLNANALSAPIYRKFGYAPFPPGASDAKLVWHARRSDLVIEKLAWKLTPDSSKRSREWFARRRYDVASPPLRWTPEIRVLDGADALRGMDRLFHAAVDEGQVLAARDAAALAWRLSDPDATVAPLLLGWFDGEDLKAWAMAQVSKTCQLDAPTLEIIDLLALTEVRARALPALVRALKRICGPMGCARLRLNLVTEDVLPLLAQTDGAVVRRRHTHGHARLRDSETEAFRNWRPNAVRRRPGLYPAPCAGPRLIS